MHMTHHPKYNLGAHYTITFSTEISNELYKGLFTIQTTLIDPTLFCNSLLKFSNKSPQGSSQEEHFGVLNLKGSFDLLHHLAAAFLYT